MKKLTVKVELEAELEVDDDATKHDIEEIIKFETHYTDRLDTQVDYDWVDTNFCYMKVFLNKKNN